MDKHTRNRPKEQEGRHQAEVVTDLCYRFVQPLLKRLDQKLDRRLVQTFFDLLLAILIHRHRNHGLLLSELGGHLLDGEHAPAGTKRIHNLLRHPGWQAQAIGDYLWERAHQAVQERLHPQEEVYVIWDERVLEKAESLKPERLCAVRSSKARRLKRIKPGYYNPPGGRPIFVPGFNWLRGTPVLAHLRYWTTRGEAQTSKRQEEHQVLQQVARRWGRMVVHIWDRGFAGAPWLGLALFYRVRFIVRWQKGYHLLAADGRKLKAWQCTRGKRSLDHRLIHDAVRRCERKTGMVYVPVRVPDYPDVPLTLVVSRPGKGRTPWYLLTNEPVQTVEDAWRMVLAYNRRWQVEVSIRYSKSELAFESPRLYKWERREKLLAMVALVQAFLFSLLTDEFESFRNRLLRAWCHRTGKRNRTQAVPLYRLRLALSSLWLAYRPLALPRLN